MRFKRPIQFLLSGMLAFALILSVFPPFTQTAQALSPNLVISQVYGGGGNSGATYTNDFIELFNRGSAPASLAGMSVQYASATGSGNFGGSSTQLTELPDVSLDPGQYLLIQEAQGSGGTTPLPSPDVTDSSPIALSASSGKVALVNSATSLGCNGGSTPCTPEQLDLIIDLVGYGSANFFEGSAAAPGASNTTAVFRQNGGCTETDDNAADFVTDAPDPRNTASPLHNCSAPPPSLSCPSISTFQGLAASSSLSATDPDGVVTSITLDSVDPAPTAGNITLDDFVPADSVGGTATATLNVDAGVPNGSYVATLTAANNDTEPQTTPCTLSISVQSVLSIGEVQGSVSDTDNGRTHASPYVGSYVFVRGLIYQKILSLTSSGPNYGFFMQSAPGTADGDPNSSDGIFVYMSRFTDLIGGYVPQVGDEVILRARVSEYFNLTELSSASMEALLDTGVNVDEALLPVVVNPPDDNDDAGRYWERLEGMRVQVPEGSIVLSGRDVFASTLDGEVWVARADTTIGQRMEPYTNRSFRDPHPLDDIPDVLFDNQNGYRIVMGSLGIKDAAGDTSALIAPARTFDTLTNAPIGGVYYSFGKYQIQVGQQLELNAGLDPSQDAPPPAFDRSAQYSVVTFNMENLYDYRDDPFDGCDFNNAANPGCPLSGPPFDVYPPYDYVPASEDAYTTRVAEIASQIVNDLHSPDIVMAQEIEDQDICTMSDTVVECGTTNNADGSPDALQDLSAAILEQGGPLYYSAFDRDGADDRGIVSAYLYRSDRVELLPAEADNPVLGSSPTVVYRSDPLPYNSDVQNPKVLNAVLPGDVDTSTGVDGSNVFTRAPQIGYFRVWREGMGLSVFRDLYLLDNHFSSTPDARVGQRTEQASYDAAIVAALEQAFGSPRVIVGGDLNVYPRPDDPFVPGDALFPSDQLAALYNQGLTNLWDMLVAETPASAYSYGYQGQAQTLDQLFTSPSILAELQGISAAHINSDFPSDYVGDGARGTSDHDPQLARLDALPDLQSLSTLLKYFADDGQITGNNTVKNLQHHLDQAQKLLDNGVITGYQDQLQAFIDQVLDFTPQFITQAASDALVTEAQLLLSLP